MTRPPTNPTLRTARKVEQTMFWIAGFSCKSVSRLNPKHQEYRGCATSGSGTTGSTLHGVLTHVKHTHPVFVILENVTTFRTGDQNLPAVVTQLRTLGYVVTTHDTSPHMFGIPQHRERLWILAVCSSVMSQDHLCDHCIPPMYTPMPPCPLPFILTRTRSRT